MCTGKMLFPEMLLQLFVVLEADEVFSKRRGTFKGDILLVPYTLPLANKTFLMMFTEVAEQFIVSKETFPTKLADRMYKIGQPCLGLLLRAKPARMC